MRSGRFFARDWKRSIASASAGTKKAFVRLSPRDQEALLGRLADPEADHPGGGLGRRFFRDLRRRTVFAYYTSREGIHQELGYQGKQVLAEWEGCPHPGHHGDEA